ncbi:ATP-binding cassette domain-containing protein [Streptomyces flaveolus]|uniref:ATP-binding cassette domain-containing protein n=1 Tax=Streptomyces flaveolus TaxID=67297 RepID=UPI0036F59D3A
MHGDPVVTWEPRSPNRTRSRTPADRPHASARPFRTPSPAKRSPRGPQGRLQSLTARQARARCVELLTAFDAQEFADTPVGNLSGGQRRRVDLAVAPVQRPDVLLLLDELTTTAFPYPDLHSRAGAPLPALAVGVLDGPCCRRGTAWGGTDSHVDACGPVKGPGRRRIASW